MPTTPAHRLLRELIALAAILAMVMGPLALATSRGLAAQERVNLAAGLVALPLCMPGDSGDGLAAKSGACDHCLPGHLSTPPTASQVLVGPLCCGLVQPLNSEPSALLSQLRLPPATGPPVA